MPCPIAYNYETRMTRAAFIRLCQAKSAEKIKRWSGGAKNYEPAYPQCAGCETGELIAAGKDFPAPAHVEWIEISDCGMRIADAGLKTVPAIKRSNVAALERLNAGTLERYKQPGR